MNKLRYKNIIFDFDGTLFDTAPGLISSYKAVLEHFNIPFSEDDKRYIGMPLEIVFGRMKGIGELDLPFAINLFQKSYLTNGYLQSIPYPGIKKLIEDLKKAGAILYIASYKEVSLMKTLLVKNNMDSYFTKLATADINNEKASIIKSFNPDDSFVMIGDFAGDIEAGKKAGIATIACLYGLGDKILLDESKPDYSVKEAEEIGKIIFKN